MDCQKSIAVLVACHNRRETTLSCIRRLHEQAGADGKIEIFIFDDGSTDGTSDAILAEFKHINLLHGDGNYYWCGGMRMAFAAALARDFDFYLWLNDDTDLDGEALQRLLDVHKSVIASSPVGAIVVGSTRDPKSEKLSYGGWRGLSRYNRLSFAKVEPDRLKPLECDSMNGNCVLISRAVAQRVGNLDPVFTHGMGDLDYGLRARKRGCRIWIAPGFIGSCKQNTGKGLWSDSSAPLWDRWKRLLGPKGLPLNEWLTFTRRHAGWLWPLHWANPYLKFWVRSVAAVRQPGAM
jgi:GT2 family glycosyltransferase